MSELVRARLEDGTHATVGASFAKSHGLAVLKQPAVGRDGTALPAKPKTSVAAASDKKKNTTQAAESVAPKEESK